MSNSNSIQFTPSENLMTMLRGYAEYFEVLDASPAAKKAPAFMEVIVSPTDGKFVRWTPEMTADEMGAVLHRVRPFILQGEPCSFIRVVGRLKREIVLPVFRDLLDRQLEKFEADEWRSFVQISSGGEVLNTNAMFKMWVNGFEYHRDVDKRAGLDLLLEKTPHGLVPWVFVKLLFEKIESIREVAAVVRVVLGHTAVAEVGGCRFEQRVTSPQ